MCPHSAPIARCGITARTGQLHGLPKAGRRFAATFDSRAEVSLHGIRHLRGAQETWCECKTLGTVRCVNDQPGLHRGAAYQALGADAARRLGNEYFTSAARLKRGPLSSARSRSRKCQDGAPRNSELVADRSKQSYLTAESMPTRFTPTTTSLKASSFTRRAGR